MGERDSTVDPLEAMRRESWVAVRDAALRDWSQSDDLRKNAPTAIGSKSQPAGGMPLPPLSAPVESHVMGDMNDFYESAMAFGFNARGKYSRLTWDEAEHRLRSDWEENNPSAVIEWATIMPFIRHGWDYRH